MNLIFIKITETGDWIAFAGLLVTILIASVSGIFYLIRRREDSKYKELKERKGSIGEELAFLSLENEEKNKKAFIEAISLYNNKGRSTITVLNTGNAVAKNIRMDFPYDDKDGIIITEIPFPYPQINARSSGVKFNIHLVYGHTNPVEITFTWDDDFSKDNQAKQFLQL